MARGRGLDCNIIVSPWVLINSCIPPAVGCTGALPTPCYFVLHIVNDTAVLPLCYTKSVHAATVHRSTPSRPTFRPAGPGPHPIVSIFIFIFLFYIYIFFKERNTILSAYSRVQYSTLCMLLIRLVTADWHDVIKNYIFRSANCTFHFSQHVVTLSV